MRNFIKRCIFAWKNRGQSVVIHNGCNIFSTSSFEGNNVINKNTTFGGKLGYGSYIMEDCWLPCDIGRYCSIGNRVRITIGTHPTHDYVSTHPAFFSTMKQAGFTYVKEKKIKEFSYTDVRREIYATIGNDVWIGDDVRILQGVTIGDGAIIGSCALVAEDVPPYAIVGGVPARIIRMRFDADTVSFLEQFQWWNKDPSWLQEHADDFEDIEEAVRKWKNI